jgi:hypothetical protein
MNNREEYYIKLFNTKAPNGYNMTDGGEGYNPVEEVLKKISIGNKGKVFSKESLIKMSKAKLGDKGYWYGKTRLEQSNRMKGENNPMYDNHKSKRRIGKLLQSRGF